jgi:hypothetical protein
MRHDGKAGLNVICNDNVSLSRKDTNLKSTSKNIDSMICCFNLILAQSSTDGIVVSYTNKDLRKKNADNLCERC